MFPGSTVFGRSATFSRVQLAPPSMDFAMYSCQAQGQSRPWPSALRRRTNGMETGADDVIGRPVLSLVARDVHRDVVEREVDEVDLVRERADDKMAVAAPLAGPDGLRREWRAERDAEGLAKVVGLVKGAVPRL